MKHASIAILVALASACTSGSCADSEAPDASLGRSAQGSTAAPIPRDRAGEAAKLQRSFEFHDGDTKRTVWLSEELVAELAPSPGGRDALLAADAAAAEVPQGQRAVRIWKLAAPQGTEVLAASLTRDGLRFSPVLHDGPSPGLPMRALPGGVVVTFPTAWNRAQIDAWLAQRKLRVQEPVVAEANVFLVATPPGLESLTIANQLHESGEVESATPNFWMQATTK
jgi:hypothetical protein